MNKPVFYLLLLAGTVFTRVLFAQEAKIPEHLKREFRVKRETNFEFAQKPTVSRKGDKVTIAFETRGFCDVTVAIEDAEGKILRHLACGVLGDNAPPPFTKGSKKQALVWDGKDERGRYVAKSSADYSNIRIRVSLGLKPRFERHLLWSPERRIMSVIRWGNGESALAQLMCAGPEGVYVYDGGMVDHLRLFDHQGRYVRTIHPFPSDKLDDLIGVAARTFPQTGRTLPYKGGNYQSTLLTSGSSSRGEPLGQLFGVAATAMAVQGKRIVLAHEKLNRLGTDGSTGGLPLEGGTTGLRSSLPRSAALSPDGRTLYLTGYMRISGFAGNSQAHWHHGVARMDVAKGKKPEVFAGKLSDKLKDSGSKPGRFKAPVSVACDARGRVYVADHFNDRVQVFDPAGKHLKSIPVHRPAEVGVNPHNGDLYVFSWTQEAYGMFRPSSGGALYSVTPKMMHFGPFDDPVVKAEYALPRRTHGTRMNSRAVVDFWASGRHGPTVWLSAAGSAPRLMRMDPEKKVLTPVRRFAQNEIGGYNMSAAHLAVNPKTAELWMTRGKSAVVVDPATGRARTVSLPIQAHRIAFDMQGHAYLRTKGGNSLVARFALSDSDRFREVPFDYGETYGGLIGVLHFGSNLHSTGQELSVSPLGHVLASFYVGKIQYSGRAQGHALADRKRFLKNWKPWKPTIFEGRGGNLAVRVWKENGKVLYRDAVRGTGPLHGLFMDRRFNLYIASESTRRGYFDKMICTMLKMKPESHVLSTKAVVPLKTKPDRPFDTHSHAHLGKSWWEKAEWFYGGVGWGGKLNYTCHCPNFNPTHDYFARSFVPETQHYSVAVLDSEGNLVLRIGQYGNADDGVPLLDSKPPQPNRRAIGGDETALFRPTHLATHSDRRLFIADGGNSRIVSVKLGYHTDYKTAIDITHSSKKNP